jgi:hypothetical protein
LYLQYYSQVEDYGTGDEFKKYSKDFLRQIT